MSSPAKVMPSRLADIVGASNAITDPRQLEAYEVDGKRPTAAARPGSAKEVAELVKLAAVENLAVIPSGSRTKLGIGMPPSRYDLAIDVSRLDRVISYDPGDLTLSVESGISVAKLAAALAEHNQFLPLEVPFYDSATIGGTLSSGVDSPLRQLYGTPRDFVLGIEFVTGEGEMAKSGGRVVKNVSGYDLHKLFLGAIGSLGVITRVNFRTFPLPQRMATVLAAFRWASGAFEFNRAIQKALLRPQAVEILSPPAAAILNAPHRGKPLIAGHDSAWWVAVGFAGNESVIARCERELCAMAQSADRDSLESFELLKNDSQSRIWSAICELPAAILRASPQAAIFRMSCLPKNFAGLCEGIDGFADKFSLKIVQAFRGVGVAHIALLPAEENLGAMPQLKQACAAVLDTSANWWKTSATIPWCPLEFKREINIWGAPRQDFPLMQKVKQAFDPRGIFAPGRFVGGL
ncbi:MAG TPA: FAD-binding oxidoreductase [Candidatus Acidoferrales bacterium]|nr:FAD-binding oxidoreductase [Candidatus Acidoferrales bacterium]